ncbi:MAG TPA: hypothetical protein PL193_07515 [Xanthobacteraceae bacterium]|nr:hypothetical protein [Xanthobacteraceae bacterium]
MNYQPMTTAPKNRTIMAKHRDGHELRVSWDKRSGPSGKSFYGNLEPSMVEGWCTRENERAVLFASDLTGWREIADGDE